jgi:hypothetical protein
VCLALVRVQDRGLPATLGRQRYARRTFGCAGNLGVEMLVNHSLSRNRMEDSPKMADHLFLAAFGPSPVHARNSAPIAAPQTQQARESRHHHWASSPSGGGSIGDGGRRKVFFSMERLMQQVSRTIRVPHPDKINGLLVLYANTELGLKRWRYLKSSESLRWG